MWQIWLFWTVRTFAHLEDDNGHVMPVVNKIWQLGFFLFRVGIDKGSGVTTKYGVYDYAITERFNVHIPK